MAPSKRKLKRKRNKTLKRKSNKIQHAPSSLEAVPSIPKDLLIDVFATIAAKSLSDFHKMKNVSSFLRSCLESENTEIIFREGLLEYFGYPNGNIDGLERLKIAAEKGHKEAIYIKQGLEHMRFLRKSKCIVSSRSKVKYLTKDMWKNNGMLMRNQIALCNSKSTCEGWRVKKGPWFLPDEDDDMTLCEDCRWDHELEFFYKLFNVY
ncbi:hypothetical protein MTR_4g112590 [Medicago truncatula]|uniref:At2g35280-like TPR domain-containing protein n=1 Tax=Medicago truncatula TaxID=3880 RepID=G7JT32_MEDTR|nr:hypothetical protein MTR_4g112590 [Medicago truncatula]